MKKLFNLNKKGKIVVVIIGVLIVVGILLVRGMLTNAPSDMAEATAVKQDMTKYYSFKGNIESKDVQNVVSTLNQPVKKLYVKEGDYVKDGDLLYEIESNTIQSTLTSASTALSNAKTAYAASQLDYDRKKELYDAGGIALVDLEQARDALSNARNRVTESQAAYDQAQKQYEDTRYYAEISGEVSKIYVKENETLMQGSKIMDIVNYDDLEVNIKVDEYDLAAIDEGMEADVYFEAMGTTVVGRIAEISRGASVENGVSYFETTITLPKDTSLRVGLSAEVKVVTESVKGAVTVPVKAILYDGPNAYMQRYDEKGKLEKIFVTVGVNNGVDIEIKTGLKEGESVVYTNPSDFQTMPFGPGGGMM